LVVLLAAVIACRRHAEAGPPLPGSAPGQTPGAGDSRCCCGR
jgi:hypothetical protein